MSKFKIGLVKAVKEEQRRAAEQEHLHEKHHVKDKNIMIVEKNNMIKFIIRSLSTVLRIVATVVLLGLATAGGIALLYPEVRVQLFHVLFGILGDFKTLVGIK